MLEAALKAQGFRVARNTPFAGAHIAKTYGDPRGGAHVIQLEINRALYMDEGRIKMHAGFDLLKSQLTAVLSKLQADLRPSDARIAAE